MILVVASSLAELQGHVKYGVYANPSATCAYSTVRLTPQGESFAVVCVGVGQVNAALNTYQAIQALNPSLVVGIGTCGALRDELMVGDILVAGKVVQYEVDLRRFGLKRGELPGADGISRGALPTDFPTWKWDAGKRLSTARTLGTADRFLVAADRRDAGYLQDELGLDAVDMESYAMVAAARKASVPVAILRTVSDTNRGARPRSYPAFLAEASERMFEGIMALVAFLAAV
jgi:adenosylhomocysteine nucleosidase